MVLTSVPPTDQSQSVSFTDIYPRTYSNKQGYEPCCNPQGG